MKETVQILKALANERRLKILRILNNDPGKSVSDLAGDIHLSFKATSRHLQKLKDARLVLSEQRNTNQHYYLCKEISPIVKGLINSV